MEVSFNKPNTDAPAATQAPPPPTPIAPPTAVAIPPARGGMVVSGGPLLGDFIPEFKDIVIPRINLVQNIGDLKNAFPPGAIVYNQTVVLYLPPKVDPMTKKETAASPPVTLVVLGFRPTRYCEKVEGGVRGLIVDTEDAVRANGGTLDYNEWKLKKASGIKRFEPLADAFVAIQKPASVDDKGTVFIYDVDGQKYALGLWGMRGTSYTAAAKQVFFTARAIGCLKDGGYPTWAFSVSTFEKQFQGGNKAWVPVCVPTAPTTPKFQEWVKQVLNAPPAATEATPAP